MFGPLIALAGLTFGVAITIVGLLAWSIRREDAAISLADRPAHHLDLIARLLTGVRVCGIVSAHDAPPRQFTVQVHLDGHPGPTTRPQYTPRPRA